MISIKGVPFPLTFGTKSTLRTHAKDLLQTVPFPEASGQWKWNSDSSLFIQIKGWDTTAGFVGQRSKKGYFIWQNRVPMIPILFLGPRGMKVMHTVMNRGRITNQLFNYYSTLPNTLPVYNWTDLMILQLGHEIPS